MRIDLEARTADDTRAVGAALTELLRFGDVVALTGELGAGKTTFVQGAARGMGSTATVLSPTFTLVREYPDGRLPIHHVDIYRLERVQDVLDLGFEEMTDDGGVVFVEWGDAVEGLMPESYLKVELTSDPHTEARRLELTGAGPAWAERWERLEHALERWEVPAA